MKVLDLIRGERLVWNHKKVNLAVYNFMYRISHDLRGEWIFFQNDFLQLFHEILSNSLVNFNKEHATILGLIRGIVSKFFVALNKNPLLAVEALVRFDSLQTKEAVLNNYDLPQVVSHDEDQQDGGFQRQVIPWSKEEDMILVENYDFFRQDPQPAEGLAALLRDQAFFRDPKDVKLRCRLLKVDQSADVARQLVEKTHNRKVSVETVATRVLLFTFAKGRHLESQLISFLHDIGEKYALHESIHPLAISLQYPVVPTAEWEFEVLDWPVIGSVLECLGCDRPTVGRAWWRATGGSRSVKFQADLLQQEIVRLGRLSERDLLDMAQAQDESGRPPRAAPAERKAGDQKNAKPNKLSRKQLAREEKLRLLEEQNRINRELAGLASDDDEELDLAEFDNDDGSSDQLDYGRKTQQSDDDDEEMAPKRRKAAEKVSMSHETASGNNQLSDMREEFREVTNNGHSAGPAEVEIDGAKKAKRLKKATRPAVDQQTAEEELDDENADPIV